MAGGVVLFGLTGAGLFFLFFCVSMTFFFLYPARVKREVAATFWQESDALPVPIIETIRTADRLRITLNWFPQPGEGPHRTLVLCHGVTSYKEEMLPLSRIAWGAGYNVCFFDFRGHGESDGRVSTIGLDEIADVAAVMEWVRAQPGVDPKQVGLLGHSMGAAAVLNYLADIDDETPYALILAPFATLERAVVNRLKRFRVPILLARHVMGRIAEQRLQRDLFQNAPINVIDRIRECRLYFIHGTYDRGNHPQDSQDLFDQAMVPKELFWIEGCNHHGLLFHQQVWQVTERILRREAGEQLSLLEDPCDATPISTTIPVAVS